MKILIKIQNNPHLQTKAGFSLPISPISLSFPLLDNEHI